MVATVLAAGASVARAQAQDPAPAPPAPPVPAPTPPAPAPPPPAPPPVAEACTLVLDVHAVDAKNHAPLADVSVLVDGAYVGATEAGGHQLAPGLCAGTVIVNADRPDYLPVEVTVELRGARSLELELTPRPVEVVVLEDTAPPPPDMRATTTLAGAALARTRGKGLAASVAEVPGVTQLGSGSAMAKPVVRGQFGRRLLLLVDGIRHRAQEWGLDHAPEIDPFVADAITVVRGAAGVQYGPDAIGGAVVIAPPELPTRPGYVGDVHLIGISNGRGGAIAGRLQAAFERVAGLAGQVAGSYRRLAAPRTPDYPLDNTGTDEWNLGAAVGYRRGQAEYRLAYTHYQARLGVCACLRVESSADFFAQLERAQPLGVELYRADFDIERPYQGVGHDLALARARWTRDHLGTITATYAFQHDLREEFDVVRQATTGPQFKFRLTSHDLDVALAHDPIHLSDHLHLRGTVGAVGMAQVHSYTGLPLVPDHVAGGGGVYAIERLIGPTVDVEAGLRYDFLARTASIVRQDYLRLVRSGQLAMDACAGGVGDPVDCRARFHTVSASLGARRAIGAAAVKLDLSTASRPPNPDEQYLNGTAPTFPVLGLGKPDLGPETTYSATATIEYQDARVAAQASAYVNRIDDYVEFAPAIGADGRPIFDVLIRGTFPRFVTQPVDALFWGADGGVTVRALPWLELAATAAAVRAKDRRDGSFLAFIPPDRVRAAATVKGACLGPLRDVSATVDGTYTARQRRYDLLSDLAPPPDGYFLLGAELQGTLPIDDQPLTFALAGQNLTNARYRDYTSLLRYFADQPGWQVLLRVTGRFGAAERP